MKIKLRYLYFTAAYAGFCLTAGALGGAAGSFAESRDRPLPTPPAQVRSGDHAAGAETVRTVTFRRR